MAYGQCTGLASYAQESYNEIGPSPLTFLSGPSYFLFFSSVLSLPHRIITLAK